MKNKLEQAVIRGLGDTSVIDLKKTQLGWVCCKNYDLTKGPKYLVAFNYPTAIDEIEFISQFTREANKDVVRQFYRSCNGMSVFDTRFVVPGVRISSPKNSGLDFFNIPLGFAVLGGALLPLHSPENGFVIGSSHVYFGNSEPRTKYDILNSKGKIVSGYFDESGDVPEAFEEIETWLETRVNQAKGNFEKYA